MRISLGKILLLSVLLPACGTEYQRNSISEDPTSTAKSEASGASNLTKTPYHSQKGWQKDIRLYVQEAAPEQVAQAVQDAIKTWNDAIGRELIQYAGRSQGERGTTLYETLDDDLTVIYYEPKWLATTGKAQTTLATTIWEDSAKDPEIITKGDIILNAESYHFQDSTADITVGVDEHSIVDTETVLLHEMGHLLGLEHVSDDQDSESVMHPYTEIGPFVYRRVLSDRDIAKIRALYNP